MSSQRGDDGADAEEEQPARTDRSAEAPPLPPVALPYASAGMLAESEAMDRFKTLRRMPQFEAGLAAAKLEAAGVRCFIADQNISTAYPILFGEVRLQVAEADLERAEQILSTTSAIADEADDDDADEEGDDDDRAKARTEREQDGYVEEAYRCPRCRKKEVDFVPLSPLMRNVRFGCLLVLVMPLIVTVAGWIVSTHPDGGGNAHDVIPTPVSVGWLIVLAVLSFIVLTAKRAKRCRACGHEWGATAGE